MGRSSRREPRKRSTVISQAETTSRRSIEKNFFHSVIGDKLGTSTVARSSPIVHIYSAGLCLENGLPFLNPVGPRNLLAMGHRHFQSHMRELNSC